MKDEGTVYRVSRRGARIGDIRDQADGICPATHKWVHSSRSSAQEQVESLVRDDGASMNVYRCDRCRGWHVGHRNPRRRRGLA